MTALDKPCIKSVAPTRRAHAASGLVLGRTASGAAIMTVRVRSWGRARTCEPAVNLTAAGRWTPLIVTQFAINADAIWLCVYNNVCSTVAVLGCGLSQVEVAVG